MPLPMFLPLLETGQQVTLPGLAPDPGGSAPTFPPGTYPIMGSGEFTSTLYPLADPPVIRPMPLPPEVSSVALPSGSSPGGLQPVDIPGPSALDMPQVPSSSPGELPLSPLADSLPTSMMQFQQAWPPFPEQMPQVPLIPPGMAQLPDVGYAPAQLAPMPDVQLPGPAMPTAPGEPLTGGAAQGWQSLLEAVMSARDQQDRLQQFGQERSILRAPIPEANTGRTIWEQHFGGG